MASDGGTFGYGQMLPADTASEFNAIAFIVRQQIAQIATTKLVRVEAVHTDGETAAFGTVDVLPLVQQIDANGNATPHGVVYGLPFTRLQGGTWAVILDPAVGDIGLAICCDRDISSVKTNQKESTPASRRRFDIADGVYLGGILNAEPEAYVLLKPDGFYKISDGGGNVLETSASGFAITTAPGGDFVVNGISVTLHTHAVITGPGVPGDTGPPIG